MRSINILLVALLGLLVPSLARADFSGDELEVRVYGAKFSGGFFVVDPGRSYNNFDGVNPGPGIVPGFVPLTIDDHEVPVPGFEIDHAYFHNFILDFVPDASDANKGILNIRLKAAWAEILWNSNGHRLLLEIQGFDLGSPTTFGPFTDYFDNFRDDAVNHPDFPPTSPDDGFTLLMGSWNYNSPYKSALQALGTNPPGAGSPTFPWVLHPDAVGFDPGTNPYPIIFSMEISGGAPSNTAPTVSCPAPLASECNAPSTRDVTLSVDIDDADGDALDVEWFVNAVSQRAVSQSMAAIDQLTHTFGLGANTVEVVVNDGTAGPVSCSTTVTIVDTIDPVAICSADVVVDTDPGQCEATGIVLPEPGVSDNCEVASLSNDAPTAFSLGTTVVTWTVTDVGGNFANCTQFVTVEDNENPTIAAPDDITVDLINCMSEAMVDVGSATTSDNCGVATITNDAPLDGIFQVGQTVVVWTAVDDSGNQATSTQLVNVVDPNTPPTANAGADQSIRADDTVNLDGSASFDDNTASASLIYSWSFSSLPAGSSAVLSDANTATPSFVADVEDTYIVQLTVTDECGLESDPAFVTVSSDNLAPTADATVDFSLAIVGETVNFDGSSSTDPEMNLLTFAWEITDAPVGSTATLVGDNTVNPSLTTDLEGNYEVTLTVSDFLGAGTPTTVSIVATTAEGFAEIKIIGASDAVAALLPGEVTTAGNQNAFGNFLSKAISEIQKGKTAKAIDKLNQAIERTDGCPLRGAPDGNGAGRDWITDCDAQQAVYDLLNAAVDALTAP